MAAITVKNIPDDLYEEIRESAVLHHRSINSEIIFRLHQSLFSKKINPKELIARIDALHEDTDAPPLVLKS